MNRLLFGGRGVEWLGEQKGKKWARREKKTFWAEDESMCVRATPSLVQSRALGTSLLAGTGTGALEQRKET